MKRITIVVWMILATFMVFCCATSAEKKTEQENKETRNTEVQSLNDLPDFIINFLDGSKIKAKKLEGNTILILFFPDCDHCQREAIQIQKQMDSFKNYTLYFLTTSPKQEVDKFAVDYKLHNYENVKFGLITVDDVLSNFGSVPTPSLYIYSEERKLVQKFNGETQIDLVLKYIK